MVALSDGTRHVLAPVSGGKKPGQTKRRRTAKTTTVKGENNANNFLLQFIVTHLTKTSLYFAWFGRVRSVSVGLRISFKDFP